MTRTASKRLILAAGFALLAALASWQARGQAKGDPLVVDLSNYAVEITAGFAGAEVLLFGAFESAADVIVVVRGPEAPITIRRKSQVAGIWMNTASMAFDHVPSYYAYAANRPVEEIANEALLRRLQIGIDNVDVTPRGFASPNIIAEWRAALNRVMIGQDLYIPEPGVVTERSDRLFRTRVSFPANVATGVYRATVYLLRDGTVFHAQTTPIRVRKAGLEAQLFQFAHEQAGLYGLVAVLLALAAGWFGHAAFRRG